MKKKTYRGLIVLAILAVLMSVAVAVGSQIKRSHQDVKHADHQAYSVDVSAESILKIPAESSFEIHFLNVGEADAALVECDGHYMLIDGGNSGDSQFIYAYLKEYSINHLDYIVCSHAHEDHVGGLAGALNYATVDTAYAPVTEYDSRAFNSFVKYLKQQGKTITVPKAGDSFNLGKAQVEILAPIDMSLAVLNENNTSIILRIAYGKSSFLFTGDAEEGEEKTLLNTGIDISSTVLKVGHHGSYTSTSIEFLKAVSPEYCVISVGNDNPYGHPHNSILEKLEKFGVKIFRTDISGTIICRSDGNMVTFESEQ